MGFSRFVTVGREVAVSRSEQYRVCSECLLLAREAQPPKKKPPQNNTHQTHPPTLTPLKKMMSERGLRCDTWPIVWFVGKRNAATRLHESNRLRAMLFIRLRSHIASPAISSQILRSQSAWSA